MYYNFEIIIGSGKIITAHSQIFIGLLAREMPKSVDIFNDSNQSYDSLRIHSVDAWE